MSWKRIFFLFTVGLLVACQPSSQTSTAAPPPTLQAGPLSSQFEITEKDTGQTFTYVLTLRFTVILDQTKCPKKDLACSPAGLLGGLSNLPPVKPPLYAARCEEI